MEKAGILALEPRLALLGAVVDKALGQEQRLGCFTELRAQGSGMHQPGFGTVAGGGRRGCFSLRHVTSVVTIIKNGHKKPAWKKFHKPGSRVSPACLATYLTWLQAGRLKSTRDQSCLYSLAALPSRRPSDNR